MNDRKPWDHQPIPLHKREMLKAVSSSRRHCTKEISRITVQEA